MGALGGDSDKNEISPLREKAFCVKNEYKYNRNYEIPAYEFSPLVRTRNAR